MTRKAPARRRREWLDPGGRGLSELLAQGVSTSRSAPLRQLRCSNWSPQRGALSQDVTSTW